MGAPYENEGGIEITPEMIEAGAEELWGWVPISARWYYPPATDIPGADVWCWQESGPNSGLAQTAAVDPFETFQAILKARV